MSLYYASTLPTAERESYSPSQNVDFLLNFEGRKIVQGSIRISGRVRATKNSPAVKLAGNEEIFLEPTIGAHSLFNIVTCSTENQGTLESILSYPRMVKQNALGLIATQSFCSSGKYVCELRSGEEVIANKMLAGTRDYGSDGAISFSIKPHCVLNKTTEHISSGVTGAVTLSVSLASVRQVLYGADCDDETAYTIADLMVDYKTLPDDNKGAGNNITEAVYMVKSTLASNQSNLNLRVPAVCNSMSATMINADEENTAVDNHLLCREVAGLSSVRFSFNDSNAMIISHVLESKEEILYNYAKSVGDSVYNNMNLVEQLNNDEGYGIGLAFGDNVDLSNQKISIDIMSSVDSANPMTIYCYFKSILKF